MSPPSCTKIHGGSSGNKTAMLRRTGGVTMYVILPSTFPRLGVLLPVQHAEDV